MRVDWLLCGILAALNRLCESAGQVKSPELLPLTLDWVNDVLESARADSEEMREMLEDLEESREEF